MDWKQLQTIIYDPDICPSSSFYVNVGDARILGIEIEPRVQLNENWSMQASTSYTDSHLISSPIRPSSKTSANGPLRALLQLELEPALRASAERRPTGLRAGRHGAQG